MQWSTVESCKSTATIREESVEVTNGLYIATSRFRLQESTIWNVQDIIILLVWDNTSTSPSDMTACKQWSSFQCFGWGRGRFVFSGCGDGNDVIGFVLVKQVSRETLHFINKLYLSVYVISRIRSSKSSNSIHINFSVLMRFLFDFGSHPVDEIFHKPHHNLMWNGKSHQPLMWLFKNGSRPVHVNF